MNRNTLNDFRHEIYRCFGKAKDALFNLADALAKLNALAQGAALARQRYG